MSKLLTNEVLGLICEQLGESHLASVAAFSLVCKEWHEILKPVLYRSISLVVVGQNRLVRDVEQCCSFLHRTASFKNVRRFEIAGTGPYTDESFVEHAAPGWRFVSDRGALEDILDKDLFNPRYPKQPYNLRLGHRIGTVKTWENIPDAALRPLAGFIAQLSALTDLVYNCSSAVPSCTLASLDEQRCRLHVNAFRVPTLDASLSAEFIQLIQSPCLFSIRAAYLPTALQPIAPGSDRRLQLGISRTEHYHDEEVVMRMVAGLAPNLAKVVMLRRLGASHPHGSPWPVWRGFDVKHTKLPPFRQGSLHELALIHYDLITEENLTMWAAHTDFKKLLTLKISAPISPSALDYLARIELQNLQALALVLLHPKDPQYDTANELNNIEATNTFLLITRPLMDLRLERNIQTLCLLLIVRHHGNALRRLSLVPWKGWSTHVESGSDFYMPSTALLKQLRHSCPWLEVLTTSIRRSKGDRTEIEAYRVLGSLPKLRDLTLTLDASDYSLLWYSQAEITSNNYRRDNVGWPPPPDAPTFDDFDRELYPQTFFTNSPCIRNGHVRDAFINSAVDESLALSIVKTMLAAKPANQPRLDKVHLLTTGGAAFTSDSYAIPRDLATVVDEISRSWVFEHSYDRDRIAEVTVKEIDRHHCEGMKPRSWGSLDLEEPAKSIYRRLWPATENGDWRREWQSFPLDFSC